MISILSSVLESESGPSSATHTAAATNQKASNGGRGKDGPAVVKMEGMLYGSEFLLH